MVRSKRRRRFQDKNQRIKLNRLSALEYDLALETYQQALAIYREVGNRAGEETVLRGIEAVSDDQGKSIIIRWYQRIKDWSKKLLGEA